MGDLPEMPERFGGYYGDGDGYDEPGWSRYDEPNAAAYRTLKKLKVVLDKPKDGQ